MGLIFVSDITKNYSYAGCAFPQTSIPAEAIYGASMQIGQICHSKGIIGHINVDFIAFWNEQAVCS